MTMDIDDDLLRRALDAFHEAYQKARMGSPRRAGATAAAVRAVIALTLRQAVQPVVIGVDFGSPDGDFTVEGHRNADGSMTIDKVTRAPPAERQLYGESFMVDGKWVDPRRVTFEVNPQAGLSAQPATQRQGEDRDGDFDVGMTKLTETKCCGQPISRHEDGQSVQWKCDKCGGSYSLREKPAPERQGKDVGAALLRLMLERGCSKASQTHICTLLGMVEVPENMHPRDVAEAVAYFADRPAERQGECDGDGMCNADNPERRCVCREEFGHRVCESAAPKRTLIDQIKVSSGYHLRDGTGASDALYNLAVKHGANEAEAAGFAHHANGAMNELQSCVYSLATLAKQAAPSAQAVDVTDEDVEASGLAYFEQQWDVLPPRSKAIYRRAIRRALNAYAERRALATAPSAPQGVE